MFAAGVAPPFVAADTGKGLAQCESGGAPGPIEPTKDGKETLLTVAKLSLCSDNDCLVKQHHSGCDMALRGELNWQFVFFAVHSGNMYKQPIDIRDYNTVNHSSVQYHTSREDYTLHGTTVKTTVAHIGVSDAVVTSMSHKNNLLSVVMSLPDDDYKQIYTVASTTTR